jgi:hypothetical protein
LHEAYFGNLGGDGRRSGAIETALGQAYGTTARWEEHIRATGMGLGGGSGWASSDSSSTRARSEPFRAETTRRSSRQASRSSSWTCTSTATRWTLERRWLVTSMPFSPT